MCMSELRAKQQNAPHQKSMRKAIPIATSLNLSATLLAAALAFRLTGPAQAAENLGYNRDVRPILSDKCFHCHGPDSAQNRKADLRLDDAGGRRKIEGHRTRQGGRKRNDQARILTTDADDHMPPAKSKLEGLTPAEIEDC